jgi:uncharacterized protein (TIGR02646 family)
VRHIDNHKAPQALIDWVAQQKSLGYNLHFDVLGRVSVAGVESDVKQAIKAQRLKDQGYLCAYTMVRISESDCHIEHIIPRTLSNEAGHPEETVEYRNMVACFPLDETEGKCPFGAHAREDRLLPITPMDPGCETRMRFQTNGRVEAVNPSDSDIALITDPDVHLLRLNHPRLIDWRKAAIEGAILSPPGGRALTVQSARRFARRVLEFKWGALLTPYCVALAHAALEYADKLEKLSRKRRFSAPKN